MPVADVTGMSTASWHEKGDFSHHPGRTHISYLDLRNVRIRFAQLPDAPSLTLVMHGFEKIVCGPNYAELSAHHNISTIALGDVNRFALSKLTNHRVEGIIPSS